MVTPPVSPAAQHSRRPRTLLIMRSASALLLLLAIPVLVCAPRASAQGYICAEGGGALTRGTWSTPIFAWMAEKSGRGPVVILAAPEVAAPAPPKPADPTIQDLEPLPPTEPADPPASTTPGQPDALTQRFLDAGAAKVDDLRPTRAMADNSELATLVANASVVFIRGGSQTEYVNTWKGTQLEAAIKSVFAKGGVVGGTSAGCAVLGEIIYDAQEGSCASRDALTDSRTAKISFTTNFLSLTPGVLFDTHFTDRARLGRLAVMLGQLEVDSARQILGIGLDARTALCISPDGKAFVMGQGSATILSLTTESRVRIAAGLPPLVTHLALTSMVAGQTYDLPKRRLLTLPPVVGERVAMNIVERDLAASSAGRLCEPCTLRGDALADSEAGQWRVSDLDDREALWNGRLRLAPAESRLRSVILQTRAFDSDEFNQNRIGGLLWAARLRPGNLAVALSRGANLEVKKPAIFRIIPDDDADTPDHAALILETAGIGNLGSALDRSSPSALGARQSVAFEGAVLHVLPTGWAYDAHMRRPVEPRAVPSAPKPEATRENTPVPDDQPK